MRRAMRLSLSALVLLFTGLPGWLAAVDPAMAASAATPQRSISIEATGEVAAPPDEVTITTGVTSDGKTAMDALKENSDAVTKMVSALKADSIAAKDIQTTNFSVQPNYQRPDDSKVPVLVGYRVRNSVRVTVHAVKRLGPILDELVKLGANDIGAIQFGLEDPTAQENEARKKAFAAALAKAKLYAKAAGVELGDVLTISEDEGGYRPVIRAAPRMEMAAKPVPIEGGTTTTSIRLHVVWALK